MESLPHKFIEMLSGLPGHENVASAIMDSPSPVAVRFNPAKMKEGDIPSDAERVPWEPLGVYLRKRPQFTFHPGLYDGHFYVQDPSAMITGEALRRIIGSDSGSVTYLDACAAPGGKTTAALANLPEGSFILANEYERDRARGLVENLQRWGTGSYAVGVNDARNLDCLGEVFDIVNADVPCSGEGMMRKNETAVTQWSPALIRECAALQREIVAAVWSTLKPGGKLIYSTCTFNRIENEENAEWIRDFLGGVPLDLGLSGLPGVSSGVGTDIPCARFLPGRVKGEGQFIAVFSKAGTGREDAFAHKRIKTVKLPDWLVGDYEGVEGRNGDLYAVEKEHLEFVWHLMRNVNIVVPGLHTSVIKGREYIPAHAMATSKRLREGAFPTAEVDYPTAISFLRGEAIKLSENTPRGIVLVETEGCRLGWAKNIGSRANNLLPAGTRIRSSHVPEQPTLF